MQGVDALLAQCEADAREAARLVLRAQQALDAALQQAARAQGKVDGVKAAQAVAHGD